MILKRTSVLTGITREYEVPLKRWEWEEIKKGEPIRKYVENPSKELLNYLKYGIVDEEYFEIIEPPKNLKLYNGE
jgi:hypothetical protein